MNDKQCLFNYKQILNQPKLTNKIFERDIERQKILDEIGKAMGFETAQARTIRTLNKIFEDLEKEIEKE